MTRSELSHEITALETLDHPFRDLIPEAVISYLPNHLWRLCYTAFTDGMLRCGGCKASRTETTLGGHNTAELSFAPSFLSFRARREIFEW